MSALKTTFSHYNLKIFKAQSYKKSYKFALRIFVNFAPVHIKNVFTGIAQEMEVNLNCNNN